KREVLDHRMRLVAAELTGETKEHLSRLRAACLKLDFAFAGIGFDVVELFEEIDVPRNAPVFPVSDRLQSGRFLLGDHAGDFAVLDLAGRCGSQFAARALRASRLERSAAQQAPDMIGAKRRSGALGHLVVLASP